MKVIVNAQGRMETVDSNEEYDTKLLKEAIVALRSELRGMLSGNIQFHEDPMAASRAVTDSRPRLHWRCWSSSSAETYGHVLVFFKVSVNGNTYVSEADYLDESPISWDEFTLAPEGVKEGDKFSCDLFQPESSQ